MYEVRLEVPTHNGMSLCETIRVKNATDVANIRAFCKEAGWSASAEKLYAYDAETALKFLVEGLKRAGIRPLIKQPLTKEIA